MKNKQINSYSSNKNGSKSNYHKQRTNNYYKKIITSSIKITIQMDIMIIIIHGRIISNILNILHIIQKAIEVIIRKIIGIIIQINIRNTTMNYMMTKTSLIISTIQEIASTAQSQMIILLITSTQVLIFIILPI